MLTKLILTATAIALAATIGSVSAADQFTTLAGFEAQAMTKQEMGDVRGSKRIPIMFSMTDSTFSFTQGVAEDFQVPFQSLSGLISNPFSM